MAGAAMTNAPPSATTIVEVAINSSIIHNKCIQGSSSAHSMKNNRYLHGSRSSGDIRSVSSTVLGSAELDYLLNSSIGVERHTSGDNHIGEELTRISPSRARANAAARRSTSPQNTGQLGTRPHERRRPIRIRHHLQELVSRSMASTPFPVDIVRVQQ